LILVTSDIIKDGFLQQNSFDEIDMYCVPAKQIRLLELIMEFHERSQSCIKLGAPLTKIYATGLKEGLSRLKSTVSNDNLAELDTFEAKMRFSLEELERSYRTREVL
jgi:V/A-type H+-transporting ATPase subunit A